MDSGKKAVALYGIYLCLKRLERRQGKQKNKKRLWMQEWLKDRKHFSHAILVKKLELTAPVDYKNFLRMDIATYEELLNLVTPTIKRQDTDMREAISPNERLSATLRFLASGQSYEDLKFLTNISPQCLGKIIMDTCNAIISSLHQFIKVPKTAEEWKVVAAEFGQKWNFHNCIGAIDGKHIHIKKPANSGSHYFNYKKNFSIVLMAVVNANYEFMIVEVGANGKVSVAGVFGQSKLKEMYDEGHLNLPEHEALPLTDDIFPYVFVGDDAFPLLENFMKPYSRTNLTKEDHIFNYRLSRARRIVENAFGILANRFRVLLSNMNLCPEKARTITLTCCYLHNYLKAKNPSNYLKTSTDGSPQNQNLVNLQAIKPVNPTKNAKEIRNKFRNYFNTVGAVSWQERKI